MRKQRGGETLYHISLGAAASCCLLLFLFLTAWLFLCSLPVIRKTGLLGLLLQSEWRPENEKFGIFFMLLSTLCTSLGAAAFAAPAAAGAAAFLHMFCCRRAADFFLRGASLLAGLPSVLYGLIGMTCVVPQIAAQIPASARSGGACLFAAVVVLSAMLMPSLVIACSDAFHAMDPGLLRASEALGATKTQTVFGCMFPAVKAQRRMAFQTAFCRAVGEATAVLLVSGSTVRFPSLFSGTRTLAGTVVLEMGYASGEHRSALFAIGLFLLIFTALLPIGGERRA